MNYIIDLVFLGIIVLVAYISSKYGFVRTLVEVAGFILITILINSTSIIVAEKIYDITIDKSITKACESVVVTEEVSAEKIWDSLPKIVVDSCNTFGIDKDKIVSDIGENLGSGITRNTKKVSQDVIKPILIKPLSIGVSLIMFLLLNPVVHLLAKLINGLVRGKLIKGINQKLGFIVGIPKGLVVSVIFIIVLLLVVNLFPKGVWIITKDAVYNSFFVKTVSNILPKNGILSYILKV